MPIAIFIHQPINKTNIVGVASLKHQQWLKWANNQNVALAHS
jgi:hypothetical protein